jgi:hypothetical protein
MHKIALNHFAIEVDKAAPCIPNFGKPNNPKIRIGSQQALIKAEKNRTNIGKIVFPVERTEAFDWNVIILPGKPSNNVCI